MSPADSPEPSEPMFVDHRWREREAQRYDAICDQVVEMNNLVKILVEKIPEGQTQTVLYKSEGMGIVGVVCATICVMTLVCLILGAILIVPEIHDLRAWTDILRSKVAKVEAGQQSDKAK